MAPRVLGMRSLGMGSLEKRVLGAGVPGSEAVPRV